MLPTRLFATHFPLRRLALSAAAATLLLHAGLSSAGCVSADWLGGGSHTAPASSLVPAVYTLDEGPRAVMLPVMADEGAPATKIVGLWKFEMISKSTPTHTNPMPDGTLIDFGTAVWHDDGTELQASGIRNPADGDICQGVWERAGKATFVLNHYALAWQKGAYAGPVNIRAIVQVDPSGQSYAGEFTTSIYAASPVIGHEFDESTLVTSITGTFTGQRVTLK